MRVFFVMLLKNLNRVMFTFLDGYLDLRVSEGKDEMI